ncbi:MAG: hypothetical protein JOZ07_18930 [Solirubrobacterales bacterium]|nr:hypothetical protein [Solirubrobacterales bacterium]
MVGPRFRSICRSFARNRSAAERETERVTEAALRALQRAPGAIVHTAPGGPSPDSVPAADELGAALGQVIVGCRSRVDRAIIAGGDTAGYATRALGAESIEAIGPIGGALLCRVVSGEEAVLALELVLKGGQVGDEGLFEAIRTGGRRDA